MSQRILTLLIIIGFNCLIAVSSDVFQEDRDDKEIHSVGTSSSTVELKHVSPLSQDPITTITTITSSTNSNISKDDFFTVGNFSSLSTVKDENASYLDIFGEFSKEYILHHLIPPTNAQCDWNWNYFRCEPFCLCDLQYKFGDYHLGRSCRLRESSQEDQSTDYMTYCHLPPNTKAYKVIRNVRNFMKLSWNKVNLPKKVDKVKNQVCSSLDQTISMIHSTYVADEMDQHQEPNLREQDWNDPHQDYHHPNDTTTMSASHGFLEKPVRALRRSLKCHDEDGSKKM